MEIADVWHYFGIEGNSSTKIIHSKNKKMDFEQTF